MYIRDVQPDPTGRVEKMSGRVENESGRVEKFRKNVGLSRVSNLKENFFLSNLKQIEFLGIALFSVRNSQTVKISARSLRSLAFVNFIVLSRKI